MMKAMFFDLEVTCQTKDGIVDLTDGLGLCEFPSVGILHQYFAIFGVNEESIVWPLVQSNIMTIIPPSLSVAVGLERRKR